MTNILNNQKSSGILIYLDFRFDHTIETVSLELISQAQILSHKLNEKVYGIVITDNFSLIEKTLSKLPLDKIFIYKNSFPFNSEIDAQALLDCILNINPSIVLIGSTDKGKIIAPNIAIKLKTGLTADCTDFDFDEQNNLVQIRPAFGGNIMASIITANTRPQIATVRPHIFENNCHLIHKSNPTFIFKDDLKYHYSQEIYHCQPINISSDISNASIIVAIGKGIQKKEDISLFEEFAEKIGAKLASSRALVEKGWMPPEKQIGLSGHTVKAKCIITCGISGSVQFMAGMKNCKNIIAINNDINARIFDFAHYPIYGDMYEIVPKLIKEWC